MAACAWNIRDTLLYAAALTITPGVLVAEGRCILQYCDLSGALIAVKLPRTATFRERESEWRTVAASARKQRFYLP